MTSQRVLLMWTPWATPIVPAPSVALLRTILMRDGIACDILYANLLFSKMIGGDPLYEQQIAVSPIADAAFGPYYFGTSVEYAASAMHARSAPFHPGKPGAELEPYRRLVEISGRFVVAVTQRVPWSEYDVVGFSLMFQQTVCSLALARHIRQVAPHLKIMFGGPSCEGTTGEELLRGCPELDYVVQGEADTTITRLVREIRARPAGPIETPGVLYRVGAQVTSSGRNPVPRNLDAIPIPDYGPYFEQLESLQLSHFHPRMYVETSRGCWWGERHHCSFCGMDDNHMAFRAKSAQRVVDEVRDLATRHKLTSFLATDSVLGHKYYETLLPRLHALREEEGLDFTFFFELKSNLTRARARMLRRAGILHVQPGIESFSDRLLALMNKGARGIQQLQALKFLAEYEIRAVWNVIYMIPGEQPADYGQMIEMMPFMHHLPPPSRRGEIQILLQRGSRYMDSPGRYGITGIRPMEYYAEIFPGGRLDLNRLAIFYEYDHPGREIGTPFHAAHERLKQALEEWRLAYRPNSLVQRRGPEFVEIKDSRRGDGPPQRIVLEGAKAALLNRCDSVKPEALLLDEFASAMTRRQLDDALEELVDRRWVYRSPNREYLSLPLTESATRWMRIGAPRDIQA